MWVGSLVKEQRAKYLESGGSVVTVIYSEVGDGREFHVLLLRIRSKQLYRNLPHVFLPWLVRGIVLSPFPA